MALLPLVLGPSHRDWHEAYFRFVERIFPGIDFRRWYARGGWTSAYQAHVLCSGSELVANVGVSRLELLVSGQPRRGAELGAVGVLPEWRGHGLQRSLMADVMGHLQSDVDLVFLFANDRVLEFYPRFGFRRVPQSAYGVEHAIVPSSKRLPRLDFELLSNRELLARLSANAQHSTGRFGARDYGSILLWYASNDFQNDFFYIPKEDALVVAQQQDDILALQDVIAAHPFDLAAILPQIVSEPVRRIEFGFTPERIWPSALPLRACQGSTLFVYGDVTLPSEPFLFPVLAHT